MSILAFAYACEPDKGSEPGAGWGWARALATLDHTYVITRANNADAIGAALPSIPERDRLTFVFVDLPTWARFWKKGRRGHRVYYLLWQFAALRAAKRLQKERHFEIVWHLTLANVWLGSAAPLVGRPFVFGPVGGGAATPLRLMPILGFRGALFELAREGTTTLFRFLNPLARLAWRRADLVLVQNPETRAWMPSRYRRKCVVFPNALLAIDDLGASTGRSLVPDVPTMLFAGMLVPMKGVHLAIEALALLPEWRLIICGTGPDERRIRRLVARSGLSNRVEFRGWVERRELQRVMREEADVLVFPSLRDQAGFAVAEATSAGLPAVCLDRGGPRLLGGIPVEARSPRATVEALAAAITKARVSEPGALIGRSQGLRRLQKILAERRLLPDASLGHGDHGDHGI